MQFEKKHWIRQTSNIPLRFHGWDYDKLDEKNEAMVQWLDLVMSGQVIKHSGGLGTTGVGLLLSGAPGLGKTTMAVGTLIEFLKRLPDEKDDACKILKLSPQDYGTNLRPVYYTTYPDFLHQQKKSWNMEGEEGREAARKIEGIFGRAEDDYMNVRLLVLDDVGKEYQTNFADSVFDEIIRTRYDKGLPTIMTTNVRQENFGKVYGEAMGSFIHEAFIHVELQQKKDRRK